MTHTYETERLLLRPLQVSDADRVEELAGDYEIAKTTLAIPHPYPKGAAKEWITSVQAANEKGDSLSFAVTRKDTQELIGVIGLTIKNEHRRGELVYWIGKPCWGKGYGTEAAHRLLRIGFEDLGLNKIWSGAFAANPASWRIMEKVGMKHEGVLRQHVMKWGQAVDLTIYSMLREEYEQKAMKTPQ